MMSRMSLLTERLVLVNVFKSTKMFVVIMANVVQTIEAVAFVAVVMVIHLDKRPAPKHYGIRKERGPCLHYTYICQHSNRPDHWIQHHPANGHPPFDKTARSKMRCVAHADPRAPDDEPSTPSSAPSITTSSAHKQPI